MWTRQIVETWRLPAHTSILEVAFVYISYKEMCRRYGGLQEAES
jgi:hypothetical protein